MSCLFSSVFCSHVRSGFFSKFLCGLSLDVRLHRFERVRCQRTNRYKCSLLYAQIKHGDLTTIQTSGNIFYENGGRVLLTGAIDHDGDGENDPEMKCHNPIGKRFEHAFFHLKHYT